MGLGGLSFDSMEFGRYYGVKYPPIKKHSAELRPQASLFGNFMTAPVVLLNFQSKTTDRGKNSAKNFNFSH